MTLPVLGINTFLLRGSVQVRKCLRTHLANKYSSFPLNKCIERKSNLLTISRTFSLESLTTYPSVVFNNVAESSVCAFTKNIFVCLHDLTGLPWWCTIASSAVFMKIYSLPWTVYQIKLMNRLNTVNNEMSKLAERIQLETAVKQQHHLWTPEKARRMYKLKILSERRQLIEKNNCHPLKVILAGYFEFPVWIIMSITWRTMAYGFSDDISSSKILLSQMITEGPFWCANLTLPDSTYILPVMIALNHLAVIELSQIQARLLKRDFRTIQKILVNLNRGFGILAALVCSFMPSSVAVFWFSSIALTFLRDLSLVSPKVRRVLKLPYQSFSYSEIFEAFKNKFFRK